MRHMRNIVGSKYLLLLQHVWYILFYFPEMGTIWTLWPVWSSPKIVNRCDHSQLNGLIESIERQHSEVSSFCKQIRDETRNKYCRKKILLYLKHKRGHYTCPGQQMHGYSFLYSLSGFLFLLFTQKNGLTQNQRLAASNLCLTGLLQQGQISLVLEAVCIEVQELIINISHTQPWS